jgi:prepilin-type N-terminal cleavage/methylation domain-containing protein
MKLLNLRRGGFTLVEIMIVVAIIGLLASIAIPSFVRARSTAQLNACMNNLRQLDGAKSQAALENRLDSGADVSGVVELYLRGGVPSCPVGNVAYTLNLVGTRPECASASAAAHNDAF